MNIRSRLLVLSATCIIMLTLVSTALAASPATDAYGGPGTRHHVVDGTLPFTGINTALLVLTGGMLVGAGVAVRRVARGS